MNIGPTTRWKMTYFGMYELTEETLVNVLNGDWMKNWLNLVGYLEEDLMRKWVNLVGYLEKD